MIATAFVALPVNGLPAAKAPAVKPVGANGAKPAAPAVKPDPVPVPAPASGQKIKTGR